MNDKYIRFIPLGGNEYDKTESDSIRNMRRRTVNEISYQSEKAARLKYCFSCGKENVGLCKSHSIPSFCLSNIVDNGKLFTFNKLVNSPAFDEETGIGNAGVFRLICRNCDNLLFREYENPANYKTPPSQLMLAQIVMKNYMKYVSKRAHEISLYNMMEDFNPFHREIQHINQLDLRDYINEYDIAKKYYDKLISSENITPYSLISYDVLDYIVPVAFQSQISLICDMDERVVNYLYNYSETNNLKDLHICIFPMKHESVIFLFVDNRFREYKRFKRQIATFSQEARLSVINNMIFLYSEEIFISKFVNQTTLQDENLIKASRTTSRAITSDRHIDALAGAVKEFTLANHTNLPNLLSKEFSITKD